MGGRTLIAVALGLGLGATLSTGAEAARYTNAQLPGLQVALRAHGLYAGPIDGVAGPKTAQAIKAFQREAGLTVDGIAGPQTRKALGPLGRPLLGARLLKRGRVGWDVSVLQFLLVRKGCSVGGIDGRFGPGTDRALRRFQQQSGLAVDGIAGEATFRALGVSGARVPLAKPPPARYRVRPGDSLTSIATRHATTVSALARANRLDPRRVLLIDTVLRVPASRGPAAMQPFPVRVRLDYWARRYALDPRLVRALAWMESGYQPGVVSSTGAFGVMQVTDATWDFVETVLLGRRVPRTTDGNIQVGTAFLRHLLRLFQGDVRLALGAYYQGPRAVQERGLLRETEAYVADVLALRDRV
jgi:soluble lytic murein transglycosylase-like protein